MPATPPERTTSPRPLPAVHLSGRSPAQCMPRNLLAHRAVDLRASRSLCKTVYYCGNNPSIAYGTYMAAPFSATVPQSSAHAEGLRQAGTSARAAQLAPCRHSASEGWWCAWLHASIVSEPRGALSQPTGRPGAPRGRSSAAIDARVIIISRRTSLTRRRAYTRVHDFGVHRRRPSWFDYLWRHRPELLKP